MAFPVGGYLNSSVASADGVIFYYPLDEGTNGANVIDAVGSFDLNTTGTPTQTLDGKFGKCIDFVGKVQSATYCRYSGTEGSTFTDYSIAFWVRRSGDLEYNTEIFTVNEGVSPGITVTTNIDSANTLKIYIRNDSLSVSLPLDTWVHIVVVADDGSNSKFYVDGVDTKTGSSSDIQFDGNFYRVAIGDYASANEFPGRLDEVVYWDRALTPTEVSNLYNSGTGTLIIDYNRSSTLPYNNDLVVLGQIPQAIKTETHQTSSLLSNTTDLVATGNIPLVQVGVLPIPIGGYSSATEASDNGVVFYYPLDESIGDTQDIIGNFDLPILSDSSNLTPSSDGKFGYCRDYSNAIGAYNYLSGSAVGQSYDWGVSFWYRRDHADADGTIFGTGYGSSTYGIRIDHNPVTKELRFQSILGSLIASFVPVVGTWYHIVCTSDAIGNAQLYINGVLEDSGNKTYSYVTDFHWIVLANDTSGYFSLDDVAYWNRSLTTVDVDRIYNSGVGISIMPSTYEGTILLDDPVAYWRLEESFGSTVNDETSNNYDATYVGTPNYSQQGALISEPFVTSNAVYFNGTDAGVWREIPAEVKVQTISVEIWAKFPTGLPTSSHWAISLQPSGSLSGAPDFPKGLFLGIENGHIALTVGDGGGTWTVLNPVTSNLSDNAWHYFVATYDNVTLRVYLDGVEADSLAWNNGIEWTDTGTEGPDVGQINVGGVHNNASGTGLTYFYEVSVDEAVIYDSTLTAAQILNQYNLRGSADYVNEISNKSPVLYWRFDESFGPTVDDETSNNYDATYVGTPSYSQPGALTYTSNLSVYFNGTDAGTWREIPAEIKVQTISVEVWVNYSSSSTGNRIATCLMPSGAWSGVSGGPKGVILGVNEGVLYTQLGGGGGSWFTVNAPAQDLFDDTWHHIAVTYDSTTIRLYIDGIEVNSGAWTTGIVWDDTGGIGPTVGETYIGSVRSNIAGSGPNIFYEGTLDEIAIYASTLTPTQIENHYITGTEDPNAEYVNVTSYVVPITPQIPEVIVLDAFTNRVNLENTSIVITGQFPDAITTDYPVVVMANDSIVITGQFPDAITTDYPVVVMANDSIVVTEQVPYWLGSYSITAPIKVDVIGKVGIEINVTKIIYFRYANTQISIYDKVSPLSATIEIDVTTNVYSLSATIEFQITDIYDLNVVINQNIYGPIEGVWSPKVLIDAVDYTSLLVDQIVIRKEENASTIAEFVIFIESGVIDLISWVGKEVQIYYSESGWSTLRFKGSISIPQYIPHEGKLLFSCTNNLQGLLRNKSSTEIISLTGGLWSKYVFTETSDMWEYALDTMSTVPKALWADENLSILATPWAVKSTPDFVYTDSDFVSETIAVEYAARRDIYNKIIITLNYRFSMLRQRLLWFHLKYTGTFCDFLWNGFKWPGRDQVLSAAEGTSWKVRSMMYINLPPPGVHQCPSQNPFDIGRYPIVWAVRPYESAPNSPPSENATPGNPSGGGASPSTVEYINSHCMGATFSLAKKWTQKITESYQITVSAPNSIDKLGIIAVDESYSVESDYDADSWELDEDNQIISGNELLPYPPNSNDLGEEPDLDTRAEMEEAQSVVMAKAKTEILDSHRNTDVDFTIKLDPMISLSSTVYLNTIKVKAKGKVRALTETLDIATGSAICDVTLAISRHGGVGVIEDTPLVPVDRPEPTEEAEYETAHHLPFRIGGIPAVNNYGLGGATGEDPEDWDGFMTNYFTLPWVYQDQANWDGVSTSEIPLKTYPEKMVVVTPEIDESSVDSTSLPAEKLIDVNIPEDLLILTK